MEYSAHLTYESDTNDTIEHFHIVCDQNKEKGDYADVFNLASICLVSNLREMFMKTPEDCFQDKKTFEETWDRLVEIMKFDIEYALICFKEKEWERIQYFQSLIGKAA